VDGGADTPGLATTTAHTTAHTTALTTALTEAARHTDHAADTVQAARHVEWDATAARLFDDAAAGLLRAILHDRALLDEALRYAALATADAGVPGGLAW